MLMILYETIYFLLTVFRDLYDRFAMATPTPNPFARILDTNKLKGVENFTDWDSDMRIILGSEQIEYVLKGPLPLAVGADATPDERQVFES